jgi:tetrahydromethanopterin S-methyltransferase subunit C
MATPPAPRRPSPLTAIAIAVRQAFWVIAAGLIGCYGFFAALGAFSPGDVLGVTIAVGVLGLLWLVHAWSGRHRRVGEQDPRLRSARERRGF